MADIRSVKPSVMGTQAPPPEEEQAPLVEEEEEGGFGRFLWNSDTKEFCGRTAMSWFLITVFYIIFFASLAAFFLLNWYGTLAFIDTKEPYKQGDKNLIIYGMGGPGLTTRPTPDRINNAVSNLIWFGVGSYDDYRFWALQLVRWFDGIPREGDKGVQKCAFPGTDPTAQPTKEERATKDKSCLIKNDQSTPNYGLCSSSLPVANPIADFGYKRGEPCILVKFNRIFGWEPKLPCDDECMKSAPKEMKAAIAELGTSADRVYVWCDGENEHDKENLGSIEYFPGPYIPAVYFPYMNQINFQTPFVMIQLKRPIPGALVAIECIAYAANIKPDRLQGIGHSRFQVMIG